MSVAAKSRHRGIGPACFVTCEPVPDDWSVDAWSWRTLLHPFHLLVRGTDRTRCGLPVTATWHRYTYEDVAGEYNWKEHRGVKPVCGRCRPGSHRQTWQRERMGRR